MEDEKQFHRRAALLLVFFVLCLLCFTGQLYNAQILHHEDYLTQSTTRVAQTETVEASRGIVTDRNGKILASNKEIYTITFDPSKVPEQEGVEHSVAVATAALRLIRLCQKYDVEWTDTLPIASTRPFSYATADATATARTRFQRFLQKRNWSDKELTAEDPLPAMTTELRLQQGAITDTLTADTVIDLMRKHFAIDGKHAAEELFTDSEARLIIGLLYEVALRKEEITTVSYVFAEDVSVELISILNDGNFHGVVIGSKSVRQYSTDYAAHILGRIGSIYSSEEMATLNAPYQAAKEAGEDTSSIHYYQWDDLVGKDGVEKAFESYLCGLEGKRLIYTNEDGKITEELYSKEPVPGATVALTIDIDLQESVENALQEAVEAMNAEDGLETRGAAAAVVSVANSDVLALASYPTYSQRTYSEDAAALNADPGMPLFNRALMGAYAPGSTYKMVTAAAALETGVISPTYKMATLGRYMYYYSPDPAASYTPACWIYHQGGGSHGRITVSEAIYHSCNYFFYEAGRLIGIDVLDQYASAFGLGESTGIELGESTGTLAGPVYSASQNQPWYQGNTLQAAIGQSDNTFTPLQLANYIATLVRGGQRYDAHLLRSVSSYDGSAVLYEHEPETVASVELSESTLAAIKKGMGDLVTRGSISTHFSQCIVSAGAKTGSAQTGGTIANGVFVCFAPFDDPEIAVAIVIEKGGSGAALASTAVNILNAYFADSDIGTALLPEGSLLP